LGGEGSTEFLEQVFNEGEIVRIVWLCGWSVVLSSDKVDAIDSYLAIGDPFEGTSVSKSPVACEYRDKEERGRESSYFTAC
jgi:hypothetical protein